jgi:hypothetical protein
MESQGRKEYSTDSKTKEGKLVIYLSRIDHDWKIRNRRQRTDIGKYSFVNRTIRLWNRLHAEILGTLPCKPRAFRKRARKVINVLN